MVSIMHVNNETGVIQPIGEVADLLSEHEVFLHVDAAQGFGKEIRTLRNKRIDLISISGHKVFGPKGVGALVIRKRGFKRPPVSPLMYGGGQERGIRPGTLPVHLIVGLGLAAELAVRECEERATKCASLKRELLAAFASLTAMPNGDQARTLPHTINLSIRGLDSEAVMLALKDLVAISNGSACTSQTYEPSHVLRAMGLPQERILGALRFSWCHATPHPDWNAVTNMIHSLQ
jgi:cysteine desulfurase